MGDSNAGDKSHNFSSDDTSAFTFARSFRRHGGMRYYVLWLLTRGPMKGSEIMDRIQTETMGWWRPSPGTIYPLLGNLEKEGLIKRLPDLRYELTDAGRTETGTGPGQASQSIPMERLINDLEGYADYLEEEKESALPYLDRIASTAERILKITSDLRKVK